MENVFVFEKLKLAGVSTALGSGTTVSIFPRNFEVLFICDRQESSKKVSLQSVNFI